MGLQEHWVGWRAKSVKVTPLDPPHGLKDYGRRHSLSGQSCPSAMKQMFSQLRQSLAWKEDLT